MCAYILINNFLFIIWDWRRKIRAFHTNKSLSRSWRKVRIVTCLKVKRLSCSFRISKLISQILLSFASTSSLWLFCKNLIFEPWMDDLGEASGIKRIYVYFSQFLYRCVAHTPWTPHETQFNFNQSTHRKDSCFTVSWIIIIKYGENSSLWLIKLDVRARARRKRFEVSNHINVFKTLI